MLQFFVAHQQTAHFGIVAAQTTVFADGNGHLGQFCLDQTLQLPGGLLIAAVGDVYTALGKTVLLQIGYQSGQGLCFATALTDRLQRSTYR